MLLNADVCQDLLNKTAESPKSPKLFLESFCKLLQQRTIDDAKRFNLIESELGANRKRVFCSCAFALVLLLF
jgi:hypothetical protein